MKVACQPEQSTKFRRKKAKRVGDEKVFLRSVGADFVQGLPCFTACYAVLQPEMLEADTLTVLSSNQYVLIIVCCLRASGYEEVCAGKP
jgi:hypothetical protein